MRVLLAEDDLVSRKVLDKFLTQYGDVDITVDGMEALDAFMLARSEGNPYDVIFLDIMMPKLDGLKVLKVIRDIESDMPTYNPTKIVMTTALNHVNSVEQAFQLGCQAYASKPIDFDKLIEVMKNLELI